MYPTTADEAARACPSCGVFAVRVKGFVQTRPRDLPFGERKLELVWRKRRWYCTEPACPRRSFTEQVSQVPAGRGSPSGCGTRPGGGCVTRVPWSSRRPGTWACPGPR
ncbi:transposase family protein [Streptomyces sp. HC307]|uniref:transposase family protein n=1 Tax=Streptomyces flavusporus TaxID=3385496 RepID=UPI00391739F9